MITVHHGDCLDVIPRLVAEGIVCDAVVTDPPYGLGFMGVGWDTPKNAAMIFDPETWATVATILRPGAFLVTFGGTRTYHRLACAIEDAGFVIQDTIAWLYGSGFPKRRNMLKPAFEPIVLAYKPGGKRTMQVDECRIEARGRPGRVPRYFRRHSHLSPAGLRTQIVAPMREDVIYNGRNALSDSLQSSQAVGLTDLGRWPANVCHDGSEEVMEAFPDAPGQSGIVTGLEPSTITRNIFGLYNKRPAAVPRRPRLDAGSAARFFYCTKADKQDRWGSRHPTVKPVELMKWLVALVTPPGGLVLDPFAGSGTTGVAALATGRNAILIEREDQYVADIRERLAFYEGGGTHSVQAKNRSRQSADHGPLFAAPFNDALDCALSYDAAIKAIGERVKAGEPPPTTGYFGKPQQ